MSKDVKIMLFNIFMVTENARVPIIDRVIALVDTKEVCMLIIGAIIGFISSMLAIAVQRFWDKAGKLSIFYAFSHSYGDECKSWGFESGVFVYLLDMNFKIHQMSQG